MFDFEEDPLFEDLTIIVEDSGRTGARRSIPIPITVQIENINDETPVFDLTSYSEFSLSFQCFIVLLEPTWNTDICNLEQKLCADCVLLKIV